MSAVTRKQNELAKRLLEGLISINSVNPGTDPDSPGEFEISEFIRDELRRLGISVETQRVIGKRRNVIGRIRFGRKIKSSRTLMINAHMDTVPVKGMSIDPLKPVVKNGFLYGRGAADTKGGLAASIASAGSLLEGGSADLDGELLLTFVVGEEYLSEGSEKIVEKYEADAAIVCEPTNLELGLAHKGFCRFLIETFGRPAHGSVPELGIDAIEKAGEIASAVNKELRPSLQRRKMAHSLAGSPTIHNSIIQGGTDAWNVVPAYCKLGVEARTIPGVSSDDVLRELRSLASKIRATEDRKSHRFKFKISKTMERLPLETSPQEAIVKSIQESARQAVGKRLAVRGMPYWTDAAILSQRGHIPSVVLGPGKVEDAHTKDEKVELSKVYLASEIYKGAIECFLRK